MKTAVSFLLVALSLALPLVGLAANPATQHKVVLDLTADSPADWEAVISSVENLRNAFGASNTEIEVVAHGKGIGLLRTTNASMAERLKSIAATGVIFAACSNTMQRMKLDKHDLLPFATVVDSGVAELVRKQEAGWAYLKGGL